MTRNLYQAAHAALMLDDPAAKCSAAAELQARWEAGGLLRETAPAALPIGIPGRPVRPVLVHPRDVPRRRLNSDEGRAALVHAIAHIEFNAINLALDAVYRFRDLPDAYYGDWLRVAAEEASHFALLQERLAELGHAYGDLPAHNGLWEMAVKTAHDPLVRMALVPRVLEARGLDVTPGMMARLRQVGDTRTVAILEVILREEIGHVAIGSRWYAWCCEQRGADPQATFLDLLDEYMTGRLRGPFHEEARRQAGFTEAELAKLNALDSN
ncbi:MAG: ferritin-like domain-containing protein [Gammaproteobacteria bacterium]|nr:ferritin-like domain-containing protein [Gammaproteobacteria bacterium]MDX5374505.1 ferritin-like domain-containing protein [Gammaproteobacteria bacterium]